jgi:hypothetical protein
MKTLARILAVPISIWLCFVLWWILASDYSDKTLSGTYYFSQDGLKSTLILKPDHTFQQELSQSGKMMHAEGSWRRLGEANIAFSKEFLSVPGQELGADGTPYGAFHKTLGFLISLTLSQYHVLWYGRVNPSTDNAVSGTYAGDEEGVPATLILKPDQTFDQTVTHSGITKHAQGRWSVSNNGDIVFSKDFLKTSGDPLTEHETASAWDPKGSNLQIQIAMTSGSGAPTFKKRQRPW